jgi:hypothetical protein
MKNTHPLRSFAYGSSEAPGLVSVGCGDTEVFAYLSRVTPKVTFGMARRGVFVHVISEAASALDGKRVRYGARWVCRAASDDAIFLADAGSRPLCKMCAAERKPTVYRFFAEDGRLLYVGFTNCLQARLRQHELARIWWSEVHSITSESFATEKAARLAEYQALTTENAVYAKPPRSTQSQVSELEGGAA